MSKQSMMDRINYHSYHLESKILKRFFLNEDIPYLIFGCRILRWLKSIIVSVDFVRVIHHDY